MRARHDVERGRWSLGGCFEQNRGVRVLWYAISVQNHPRLFSHLHWQLKPRLQPQMPHPPSRFSLAALDSLQLWAAPRAVAGESPTRHSGPCILTELHHLSAVLQDPPRRRPRGVLNCRQRASQTRTARLHITQRARNATVQQTPACFQKSRTAEPRLVHAYNGLLSIRPM